MTLGPGHNNADTSTAIERQSIVENDFDQTRAAGGATPLALAEPVFDRCAALERLDGDEDLFTMLLAVYREDSGQLLEQLAAAMRRGDLREIERAAHSLKGLAANFEAIPARDAAFTVEQSARCGNRAMLVPTIRELEVQFARLRRALDECDQA
jgi:HPt (histidine-containing phosphotransfer) domain-containing protein